MITLVTLNRMSRCLMGLACLTLLGPIVGCGNANNATDLKDEALSKTPFPSLKPSDLGREVTSISWSLASEKFSHLCQLSFYPEGTLIGFLVKMRESGKVVPLKIKSTGYVNSRTTAAPKYPGGRRTPTDQDWGTIYDVDVASFIPRKDGSYPELFGPAGTVRKMYHRALTHGSRWRDETITVDIPGLGTGSVKFQTEKDECAGVYYDMGK